MPKRLPNFFRDGEAEQLIGAADTERDRLAFMLMWLLGLRVSEVTGLRVEHLDFRRRTLWVRRSKMDRDRCLPIPAHLCGPLRGWVGGRREGYVFPGRSGGRLTTRALQKAVKRLAERAKLPGATRPRRFHCHALRHTAASQWLESGASLAEVQRLLGHSDLATSAIYLHCLSDDRLRQAVDRRFG